MFFQELQYVTCKPRRINIKLCFLSTVGQFTYPGNIISNGNLGQNLGNYTNRCKNSFGHPKRLIQKYHALHLYTKSKTTKKFLSPLHGLIALAPLAWPYRCYRHIIEGTHHEQRRLLAGQ